MVDYNNGPTVTPTYFMVEWNQATPHDYTGTYYTNWVDSVSYEKMNRIIYVSNTVSVNTNRVNNGDYFLINQVPVSFLSADLQADMVGKINAVTSETKVVAQEFGDYIFLGNSTGNEGLPFTLTEGNGALGKLGFTAGVYDKYPSYLGFDNGGFTAFNNGDHFTINGVDIEMTSAGGLDQDGAVSTINALTHKTDVFAMKAGSPGGVGIQLTSRSNQPWIMGGPDVSKLGFNAGIRPLISDVSYELSINITKANVRWSHVINQLEQFSTPSIQVLERLPDSYLRFMVGYEYDTQVFTVSAEGEPNAGAVLTGPAAIKRAVARGLIQTSTSNAQIWDPTVELRNGYAVRPNPVRTVRLTTEGIDTLANIATIESNITVTLVTG